MSRDALTTRAKHFVLDAIESVEQLEILLLLANAPDRDWSNDDVARELRSSPRSAHKWLKNLVSLRLLAETSAEGRFRFMPQTEDLRALVAELGELYATHRVSIIELIFNKPHARLRSFADAFKIREDK